jgi:hypothetical protein
LPVTRKAGVMSTLAVLITPTKEKEKGFIYLNDRLIDNGQRNYLLHSQTSLMD